MEIVGAAQSPKSLPWKKNEDGPRTLEQAIAIAKQNGVVLPAEVEFLVDEWDLITESDVEAHYLDWKYAQPGLTIRWSQFFRADGKIPVFIRSRVLEWDEGIVAIFGHEVFELEGLRQLFAERNGVMTTEQLFELVAPGISGNLHDQAWDYADQLVEQMRKKP